MFVGVRGWLAQSLVEFYGLLLYSWSGWQAITTFYGQFFDRSDAEILTSLCNTRMLILRLEKCLTASGLRFSNNGWKWYWRPFLSITRSKRHFLRIRSPNLGFGYNLPILKGKRSEDNATMVCNWSWYSILKILCFVSKFFLIKAILLVMAAVCFTWEKASMASWSFRHKPKSVYNIFQGLDNLFSFFCQAQK